MLNAIIRFALRYRLLIVALSLVVLIYGSYQATTMPIDVFPDLDRPRVVIMTECPGMAPEEVETLVTAPLESAMLGANGAESVRSQSGMGLSIVTVEFTWGTDIHVARQTVQERLTSVGSDLPEGVRPQLEPISSILGQILMVGVYRRPGPNGGVLAPIGKTPYMAELLLDQREGQATVWLWNPRADGKRLPNPADWKPVLALAEPLALQPTGSQEAPVLLQPVNPQPLPDGKGQGASQFVGRIGNPSHDAAPDIDRTVTVTLADKKANKPQEIVFLSFLHRQLELRTLADWVVRPRILKVAGVAQVVVVGGGRKQYQVLVDPHALLHYDVTLAEVEEALRKSNVSTSGGYAERGEKEQPIRFLGRLGPEPRIVLADLRQVPVKTTAKRTILLEEVARVTEGPQLKRGDSSINGQPGVLLTVLKQPHTDTRALSNEIEQALGEVEQSLPADVVINTELFRMKRFIDQAVWNVGEALLIGAVLVLGILFLFLLNFRTTFISLAAIPLSLAITVLVFKLIGWWQGVALSINVMTLGGIAVAMGELVDDAIVDVENIFRRLRENNAKPQAAPVLRVIYEASSEVRNAIVFGTLMVILVFVPLFALSGMEGRLFTPLAIAYIVSILASLLVSLTVTPVMSYYLLARAKATHRHGDSPLLRVLKWSAGHLVRFSMKHAGALLAATWILVLLCVGLLWLLDRRFLPEFDEGSVQVNVILPPDASLEASNKLGDIVDAKFEKMQQEVRSSTSCAARVAPNSTRTSIRSASPSTSSSSTRSRAARARRCWTTSGKNWKRKCRERRSRRNSRCSI